MRPDAQNLKAIHDAIRQHNSNCGAPLTAILLNPYEVERLGWDDYLGIPIEANEKIANGRFKLVCEGQHGEAPAEAKAVSEKRKVGETAPV